MTILFFSRLFYPHIGGVEKHVWEIARRLTKKGNRVIVVSEEERDIYQSGNLSAREVLDGVFGSTTTQTLRKKGEKYRKKMEKISVLKISLPAFARKGWFKKWYLWYFLLKHKKLIEKADLVHCHDVFFWYLPFRLLYPQKPVYITFHGYETVFPPTKKAVIIRKISEWLSNGNICVGSYIEKWYGTKPSDVTYGGVNSMKNLPFDKKLAQGKQFKILFIGRLEKDTGIPTYLKTLEILRRQGVTFTFEACGDGSLREEIERWGKVHGFIDDLGPFLARSDIVFTSSYLSILESMNMKRLIFSTYDNPLKKDYLKKTPFSEWIIIESNPARLADKIISLLKNRRLKNQLVDKGYNWVKQQTWEEVTNLYLKLWNKHLT